jgi:hypothetical protein
MKKGVIMIGLDLFCGPLRSEAEIFGSGFPLEGTEYCFGVNLAKKIALPI